MFCHAKRNPKTDRQNDRPNLLENVLYYTCTSQPSRVICCLGAGTFDNAQEPFCSLLLEEIGCQRNLQGLLKWVDKTHPTSSELRCLSLPLWKLGSTQQGQGKSLQNMEETPLPSSADEVWHCASYQSLFTQKSQASALRTERQQTFDRHVLLFYILRDLNMFTTFSLKKTIIPWKTRQTKKVQALVLDYKCWHNFDVINCLYNC